MHKWIKRIYNHLKWLQILNPEVKMQRDNFYIAKKKKIMTNINKILAQNIWQHIISQKCNEIEHY